MEFLPRWRLCFRCYETEGPQVQPEQGRGGLRDDCAVVREPHPAGATLSTDFEIQNIRVLASQVVLDSALVESFNRVLAGRSLVFSHPTAHTQQSTVPPGVAEHNVTVARAVTKLMGAFVTFWDNDAGSKIHLLANRQDVVSSARPGRKTVSWSRRCSWAACSTRTIGHFPQSLRGPTTTRCATSTSTARYLRHSLIAGFPTKRVPKMPLSGVSTRSGDLARFTFKADDGRVHPPDSLSAGDALWHWSLCAGLARIHSSIGRGAAALKLGDRGLDSTRARIIFSGECL